MLPPLILYFYPRPLRGGRHGRAGGVLLLDLFLSTPSARRATAAVDVVGHIDVISIHALCEEGDVAVLDAVIHFVISIHALCEEGDLSRIGTLLGGETFLSTPSARRATFFC